MKTSSEFPGIAPRDEAPGRTRSGQRKRKGFGALVLMTALGLQAVPASALADRQMNAAIGEPILSAQECLGASQPDCAVEALSPLLDMTPTDWERFVILRMRGVAYYQQNRIPEAIEDFEAALATGAAQRDEAIAIHINVGQLYVLAGQPDEAIAAFENAVGAGAGMTLSMSLMLAQAYAQAGRFEEGAEHARRQLEMAAPANRNNYNLALLYAQEMSDTDTQRRLLAEMTDRWPDDESLRAATEALEEQ